jgi:branched-chain amino acid aminotransferase
MSRRTLKMEVTRVSQSRLKEVDFENLEFGKVFSDHMFMSKYAGGAWNSPKIVPYGNIDVAPSLCTLHYGQTVFDGLKAYRTVNGATALFRPDSYCERFNRSCARLCIPQVSRDTFMGAVNELCKIDAAWIPTKRGSSLYIRPFAFATDNFIGVRTSDTYLFMVITSPVAAYYKEGLNPVKLATSGEYVRAVRGGLGAVKTAANYAASILPAEEAHKKGFTQVLWLDAIENRYIEEVGTMNIMFLFEGELVTPPLDGSILGGITRDTVIRMAHHWGITVNERRISIDEVMSRAKDGSLKEVFGTGTAAVISPVGWISHKDDSVTINGGAIGAFSQKLYDEITGIQYGERPDLFGWVQTV